MEPDDDAVFNNKGVVGVESKTEKQRQILIWIFIIAYVIMSFLGLYKNYEMKLASQQLIDTISGCIKNNGIIIDFIELEDEYKIICSGGQDYINDEYA